MPMNVIIPALELAPESAAVREGTGRSRCQGRSDRRDRDRQGDGGAAPSGITPTQREYRTAPPDFGGLAQARASSTTIGQRT